MDVREGQFQFVKPTVERNSGPKDHRHGHRARLRERFLKGGPEGVADYELLELLLFLGIPRRDVKPLAKQLIERFGGYAAVLTAEADTLLGIKGLSETAVAAIKVVQASALILARSEAQQKPVLSNWQAVEDYLRGAMAHLPREQFRLLLLDKKNALVADKILSEGTVDQTAVYPREILRYALEYDASALILVHNHPSGDPSPSEADVMMTTEIVEICTKVGVQIHDHIIIGKFGQTSFRQLGLI
ncbi:MAG: DNA repair protein RadC [Kordiimonas sp.]